MKQSIRIALLCGVCLAMVGTGYAQEDAVDADTFIQEQQPPGLGQASQNGAQAVTDDAVQSDTVQPVVENAIAQGLAEAKAELEDKAILAKKVDLARKMHQIRPTREQVDSAVLRASFSLPPEQRDGFVAAMRGMLNYNAIERISIDSMVETYTLKELESMVEYFSKPEAISASNKTISWAEKVQPEIVRMIDKAMMRIRTGQ